MFRGRLADRGYHDQPRRRGGRQGKGRTAYVWQVVAVPDTDANVFLGRLFRWTDLQRGEWPPGFRFQNVKTNETWTS